MSSSKADGDRLKDKVAIVTGAGTGIGEAIAHKFAREGARVMLSGLPEDPLEDVAERIRGRGGEAIVYAGDVAEAEQAEACIDKAIKEWDQLDVVVNNAGVFLFTGEMQDYPDDLFDRMLRMNIRSAYLMTKHALPHLHKSRGCLLYAGSEAGRLGLPDNAPYGGTKGFMHAFMKGVAVEQAKHGVRANCVCPGPIDTAWTHKETGPMNEQMEKMMVQATPLGRRGTPAEVANVYAFLASDEASYVTGALYFVDGGITVAKGSVGGQVPDELRQPPDDDLGLHHQREGLEGKHTESAM